MQRPAWLPDPFILTLVALIVLASFWPVRGAAAQGAALLTNAAIALLFFLHGAKLSLAAVLQGMAQWRLQGFVLAVGFVAFPLLGWAAQPLLVPLLGADLARGVLYLCVLPSTVQSAIALTSMARGNVSAAVCAAAVSSLVGVFATPALVLLLMGSAVQGLDFGQALARVALQLLLPFVLGQWARRWLGRWVQEHRALLRHVDQSSIYLVIYTAFSKAVVDGLWHQLPAQRLALLLLCCLALLALVLWGCHLATLRLGFAPAERITALFAASQKSLATGVPIAQVLFAGGTMGALLLPLMVYHQVQLMACAALARRFQARPMAATEPGGTP
ncbi:bile acid:sodium symporter family protein [Comamonas sp. NLF-1-9]|uniref:bile acid:sodium symporter family protein n=1 Tax=Comamonas sp. NLF-1-9 TaxID=2853163 RepID=UPI001C43F6DE|nr:bile acid:sodium symporter family protein [Comamonas sp. NLF-1-9]QXL84043.1 bile acid:sodium symporter [Comamonas sp. NLF-1-9]